LRQALVTGASGFVGGETCRALANRGWRVRMALRAEQAGGPCADPTYERTLVGEIGPETDWAEALAGVESVVHLAARVHVMRERAADPDAAFARINTQGTLGLARAAAAAGIRRFVYVSSVKVNGEATAGRPFTEEDPPNPSDAYARSKANAEQGLARVAAETGLETVVVRPPLVYGPNVAGNLRRILGALDLGLPLPLGSVANRRSMVGVWNLADLLALCAENPAAVGQTFLAADQPDLSTPELIRLLAAGLGKTPRLWPLPPRLLHWVGAAVGRGAEVERLCGSLQVSAEKARHLLGWVSPVPLEEGLRRTARAYSEATARMRQA
jgi:nucleoside-diphosphate-sugar epimerase